MRKISYIFIGILMLLPFLNISRSNAINLHPDTYNDCNGNLELYNPCIEIHGEGLHVNSIDSYMSDQSIDYIVSCYDPYYNIIAESMASNGSYGNYNLGVDFQVNRDFREGTSIQCKWHNDQNTYYTRWIPLHP